MSCNHENIAITVENGMRIPCEMMFPDDAKTFVIITHGFGSSKESATAQMMLHDLSVAGLGAIAYDLPAHGKGDALGTDLTIENCIASLAAVRSYIMQRFDSPRIFYFSSSFGAYLTMLGFSKNRISGDKAFLRSAAVNMPELFIKDTVPEMISILQEQGYYTIEEAGPAPVRITKQFFEELKAGDLFEAADNISFDELDVQMVHGEKDEVIDPEAAKRFADENDIPLAIFQGEDHTLSTYPGTPGVVSHMAVNFFNGK